MADERYRADNYGYRSPEQAGRSARRYADGDRWDTVEDDRRAAADRYPSGRPRTQPMYRDDAGRTQAPRYNEGGYSARATYGRTHDARTDRQQGAHQGGEGECSEQPGYASAAERGHMGASGYAHASWNDAGSDRTQAGRRQESRYAFYDDGPRSQARSWDEPEGSRDRRASYDAAGYGQLRSQAGAGRYNRPAPEPRGRTAQQRPRTSQRDPRGPAPALGGVELPEPIARALDALRANPVLIAAIVGGVALIVVIVLIASCVAGNAQQGYVQAVSSQGADAAATPATDASATPTDSADSATGTDAATAPASTDAGAGADTAQQQTDPTDQTPHDVDDVTTVGDVWSYSTTSFNKDAAYNNGGVEDPWSPTGYFTTGDAELDQMVKSYCDGQAQDGLDAGDNAYYTYLHISWIDYVENDNNQRPWDVEGDWRVTYAKQCFTNMTANCYEFAAAIQYIMRYYGYADAIAEPCLVLKQSGAWGDHGLVFLTSLDGRQCLIDASLSSNGWLLPAASMTYKLDSGYRAS